MAVTAAAEEVTEMDEFLMKVFKWDELGLSSFALESLEGIMRGASSDADDMANLEISLTRGIVLSDLHMHYAAFCQLLYATLLDPLLSYRKWVALSTRGKVSHILSRWRSSSSYDRHHRNEDRKKVDIVGVLSLCDLYSQFICPCLDRTSQSSTAMLKELWTSLGYTSAVGWNANDDDVWEEAFVDCICSFLSARDMTLLEAVVELAEASAPTISRAGRCIKEISTLVQLVVGACEAFDDTAHEALQLLWRLVLTTPEVSVAGMEALFSSLDTIQSALSACDILKTYMHTPPLSLLTAARRGSREEKRLILEYSNGYCYLSPSSTKLQQQSFRFHRHAMEIEEEEDMSLAKAMLIRMCVRLESGGDDTLAQVLADVIHLQASCALNSLCVESVGAIVLNAAICLCSPEYIGPIIDSLLLPDESLLDPPPVDDLAQSHSITTQLRDLGVSAKITEMLVANRCISYSTIYAMTTTKSAIGPLKFSTLQHPVWNQVMSILSALNSIPPLIRVHIFFWICEDLDVGRYYLDKLLTTEVVSSELSMAGAYFHLTGLLRELVVYSIPLQLKGMHPAEVVRATLQQLPGAYLNVDALDDLDNIPEEEEEEEKMYGQRKRVARLPAQRLIEISLRLQCVESENCFAEVLLAVVPFAVNLGDTKGSFNICISLLPRLPILSIDVAESVLSTCEVVVAMFDESDCDQLQRKRDLIVGMYSHCPVTYFVNPSNPLLSSEPRTMSADEALELVRSNLLRLFGVLLVDSNDSSFLLSPLGPAAEIASSCVSVSLMSDIVGLARLIDDVSSVDTLLVKLAQDIQRKMASTHKQTASMMSANMMNPTPLNEKLVSQLVDMGFSRHGAIRSVTLSSSSSTARAVETAVAYAFEHVGDVNFNDPLTHSVSGALRSSQAGALCKISGLHACLDAIKQVHELLLGTSDQISLPPLAAELEDDRVRSQSVDDGSNIEIKEDVKDIEVIEVIESVASESSSKILDVADSEESILLVSVPSSLQLLQPPKSQFRDSAVTAALGRASSLARLQSALEEAEVYCAQLTLSGTTVPSLAEALLSYSQEDEGVIQAMAALLLGLAQHRSNSAFKHASVVLVALPTIVLASLLPVLALPTDSSKLPPFISSHRDPSLNILTEISWMVAAHRLRGSFLDKEGNSDRLLVTVDEVHQELILQPVKLLCVLSGVYADVPGSALPQLEQLKCLGAETLKTLEGDDAIAMSKRCMDDLAALKRVSRVEGYHLMDVRRLIKSETLLAEEDVATAETGLRELCTVLTLESVVAWGRAVGRLLGVGPSDLYLRGAFIALATANAEQLEGVLQSLRRVVNKLQASHVRCLCMAICSQDYSITGVTWMLPKCVELNPTDVIRILQIIANCFDPTVVSKPGKTALAAEETDGIVKLIDKLIKWNRVLQIAPTLRIELSDSLSGDFFVFERVLVSLLLSPEGGLQTAMNLHSLLHDYTHSTCDDSYALPSFLTLLLQACDKLVSGSVAEVSSLVRACMSVLREEELALVFRRLHRGLTRRRDAGDLTHLQAALRVVRELEELEGSGTWARQLLETRILLLELRIPCGNMVHVHWDGGEEKEEESYEYCLDNEEDKLQLLRHVIAALEQVRSIDLRLLMRLLRCWGMSVCGSVGDAMASWVPCTLEIWGASSLTCKTPLSSDLPYSEHCVACIELVLSSALTTIPTTIEQEEELLELLVVDAGIMHWGRRTAGMASRTGVLNTPASLLVWAAPLSVNFNVLLRACLGGEFADALISFSGNEAADPLVLLIASITASPQSLLSSPHLADMTRGCLKRFQDRLSSAGASQSREMDTGSDGGSIVSLAGILRQGSSDPCHSFPIVMAPLMLIGQLIVGGAIYEAAQIFWMATGRSVAYFESDLAIAYLLTSLASRDMQLLGARLPEAQLGTLGWDQMEFVCEVLCSFTH